MKLKLVFDSRLPLALIALLVLFSVGSTLTAQVSPKDREDTGAGNSAEKELREKARRLNNPGRRRTKNDAASSTPPPRPSSTKPPKASAQGTAPRSPAAPVGKTVNIGNQVDDAIELGNEQRKAERYSAAEQAYKLAMRLDPKDSRPYVGLGNIYSDQKKYTEAINFFSEAIRLSPDDPAGYFGRGYAYYQMGGKDNEAIEDGKQAVRLNTDEDTALWGIVFLYNNRSVIFNEKNRLEEAVLFYKEQIRRKPDYVKTYIALGWAYQLWSQPEKTVQYYRKAIDLKPDYADVYRWLAEVYSSELKQHTDAIESIKQYLRLKPDDASSHVSLGGFYQNLKRYAEAIEAYKQAIRLSPEVWYYHARLGDAYYSQAKYVEAIDAYKQAIRFASAFVLGYLHRDLGAALYQLKRYNEAVEACLQAIRLEPDDAAARHFLGRSYIALDNKRGAEEQVKFFNGASDDYKKDNSRWIVPFLQDFNKKWPAAENKPN